MNISQVYRDATTMSFVACQLYMHANILYSLILSILPHNSFNFLLLSVLAVFGLNATVITLV